MDLLLQRCSTKGLMPRLNPEGSRSTTQAGLTEAEALTEVLSRHIALRSTNLQIALALC